ncbi:DUF6302 family protein [Streptomyces sp. NPDC058280]|uniref:DUF6302 family protein n=1 Tax=Streptomyces sp. NPDC058280 TaxID=3346419 RepID=UPI0036E7B8E4
MQHTMQTDLATMRERLADPSVLDSAVVVPVGETDGIVRSRLAVPVGGGRRAGYLTVADYSEALATLAVLNGQPGFPHLRVRGIVISRDARRTIIWGEDPPTTGAVDRWKLYGYSDEAIARYAQQTPQDEQASNQPPATALDPN